MSRNLGQLINLDVCADRVMLIDCRVPDAPAEWTGRDIEQQSDAIARGLLKRGLSRGDRVAILASNRAEYLTAYYGTMRAGLVSVPVNHKLAADTVEYVLRDSGAKLAFVDNERALLVPRDIPQVSFDDTAGFTALCEPGDFDSIAPADDEVAMFLYTSGSTGKPKGVPLTHFGHRWVIDKRLQAGVDYATERLLVAAPLYHMNALAIAKFAAFAGAHTVLLPQFSAATYIAAIARYRCTWLTSVPTMMALVAQQKELLAQTDLTSVRSVRMGSAPVTMGLVNELREIFSTAAIQLGYGTTESGPVAFVPHPDRKPTPDLALGVAHPDVDMRLVDGDNLNAEQGVLAVKCPAVTPGYHNLPEKTASVMSADGYYNTGDIMRRDSDGFYTFVGRDDDMFVCNGENVFPEEVERIIESHPGVAQACVVPVEDAVRGQMPVAFVVPSGDPVPTVDDVKQHTIANGPAYQHPRHVFFADILPLAGTNKVDRKQLAVSAASRVATSA